MVDRLSMSFSKETSAGYLANHLARLFAQALHKRIGPLGLAPAQFMALLELWSEDGLTQAELVSRLDVEQATMAKTVSRMERDGLVRRRAHPDDGRKQQIYLTAKAKRLRQPATDAAKAVNETALRALTRREREALLALMMRTVEGMRAESLETPSTPHLGAKKSGVS